MKKVLLFKAFALVDFHLCTLSPHAQEAYDEYTYEDSNFTYYYDTQRSARPGVTYDLNAGI